MKISKREMLKHVVQTEGCYPIKCEECPYNDRCTSDDSFLSKLARIGAVTVLRQNRKKFDPSKVLTVVTADKAKVGMKGYFADNLTSMEFQLATKRIQTLLRIKNERSCARFVDNSGCHWYLFYPIDEEVEE